MMRQPFQSWVAGLVIIMVLCVSGSALFVAPQSAHAIGTAVTVVGGPGDSADILSSIKNAASYVLDISNTAANVAKQIKSYVLDPIAFVVSGNLLKSITSSILGFVGGKNGTGKPLYVQNLQGYLQNVGDVQAYNFLGQFSRNSNSPFAGAISSSLRNNYLQDTSLAGFFAANKNTLGQASSNPSGFLAGNWSLGGVAAWFSLTTQCQNNPYCFFYTSQNQMARSVQGATSAKLAQLNWGQGFLSWCGSAGGLAGAGGAGGSTGGVGGTGETDDTGAGGGTDYGGVSCPDGTENVGSGGCARLAEDGIPGYYVLPNDYSCSPGTTFNRDYGGCEADGVISVPNDANGNPAYAAGSAAAQDFDGSGDAYNGKPDTATVDDGTAKFSTAGKNLSATTDLTRLNSILNEASKSLPASYRVVVTSAQRGGGGGSAHDFGSAVDIKIIGPNGAISNRGDISATGVYKDLAIAAYNAQQTLYPELGTKTLRWGGCFDTSAGSGVKDGMHYDLTGKTRPQGRYCSSGLSGLASAKTSLVPQNSLVASAYTAPSGGSSGRVGQVLAATIGTEAVSAPSAGVSGNASSVRPGDPCTKSDGTEGTIQTPGSIIKAFLTKALGSNIDKLAQVGDISASISGIMSNIGTVMRTVDLATSLFGGSSGGLSGFSGNSSYDSPFADYLNSPAYLGTTVQDIASNASALGMSGTDLAGRAGAYGAAWATIGNTANAAAASLTTLANSCPTQAGAAGSALSGAVKPVQDQAAAAAATVVAARELSDKVASEGAAGDSAYATDVAALASARPTAGDIVTAEHEATAPGLAEASPVGSLQVGGGTIADRMNLIKANADATRGNSALCPPPSPPAEASTTS